MFWSWSCCYQVNGYDCLDLDLDLDLGLDCCWNCYAIIVYFVCYIMLYCVYVVMFRLRFMVVKFSLVQFGFGLNLDY